MAPVKNHRDVSTKQLYIIFQYKKVYLYQWKIVVRCPNAHVTKQRENRASRFEWTSIIYLRTDYFSTVNIKTNIFPLIVIQSYLSLQYNTFEVFKKRRKKTIHPIRDGNDSKKINIFSQRTKKCPQRYCNIIYGDILFMKTRIGTNVLI